uniref:G_PROTEIN_RECEP_F1_2 domain-containing protein n=1 Tax=Steinernema glaseri TaxID=37863 RepID=A0A1I7Z8Q9_9BILA
MSVSLSIYGLAGLVMVLLSFTFMTLNVTVLAVICRSQKLRVHTAYKFMLLMGVFDISQGCAHFITGLFTIMHYDAEHWMFQVLTVMASPGYQAYIFVTILLAFHRFVLFCLPAKEKIIFSRVGVKIWFLLAALVFSAYASVQLSGLVFQYYSIESLRLTYDTSRPWTSARAEFVFYYEIIGVLLAWAMYAAVLLKLVTTTLGRPEALIQSSKALMST